MAALVTMSGQAPREGSTIAPLSSSGATSTRNQSVSHVVDQDYLRLDEYKKQSS